jgi:hypothetical protein
MGWFSLLLQTVLVASAILLLIAAYEIRDILLTIKDILDKYRPSPHHNHHTALTNYSTWTYRNGNWELAESRVESGFEPGEPPRRPGAYEGETVRRPAVRSK